MMEKRASITLIVPGTLRAIAISVVLIDLARKLGNASLAAGRHEIIIHSDGSIMLNGSIFWKPKALMVDTTQKKVG